MSNARNRMMDYLNNHLTPRQRQPLETLTDPGGWAGIGSNGEIRRENEKKKARNAERAPINAKVEARDKRMGGRQASNAEQYLMDRRMDVEEFAPTALMLGAGTLGIAGICGLANAYSQQTNDYLPNDPFAVTGRAISNLYTATPVGTDPLAEARNNVNTARNLVGSENMLAALAEGEITQMRSERELMEAAMSSPEDTAISRVTRDMVDSRAKELMQTPIQYSDGSVRPMRYDEAVRHATEQVNMEMRANQVY